MTILDVVKGTATVLGMKVPTQVYGSTTREWVEMQELANVVAAEIAEAHDWQGLLRIDSFVGDDVSEAFALPSDYQRMLKTASMWSSRWFWSINHINDPDQWLELQVVPIAATYGNWMLFGDEIHVLPVMSSTETVKFFYASNQIVLDTNGMKQVAFQADTDVFRLPESLLKLAIIARWKQNKGLPYGEAMADYEKALALEIDKDAGSKPIISGQPAASWRGRNIAWPGSVTGAP
jgi:hypothetical protein